MAASAVLVVAAGAPDAAAVAMFGKWMCAVGEVVWWMGDDG